MALNPAYATHSSRKLPLAFGYVLGAGDQVLNTVASDGSLYGLYLLGEGEWDGPEMSAFATDTHLFNQVSGGPADRKAWLAGLLPYAHFHSGAYATKGLGNTPTSTGPQQAIDAFFPMFPTVTPAQWYSGIAYAIYYMPGTQALPFGTHAIGTLTSTMTGTMIWRTTRCRQFDASGNVTAYNFTCNPAWHFVEAILRYKIKPQQPPIAGLTAAEKACFDWVSITATAARNDVLLPNGNPRFMGSYIFASDASLTNILETILRVSRSYSRVVNNQIQLIGDDMRAPVFTMSLRQAVPGTLKLAKKDVSKLPNVFVPRYRDLDMPAVTAVATATKGYQPGVTSGTRNIIFTTETNSPFLAPDLLTYGGSSDPTLNNTYQVVEPVNGSAQKAYIPGETYVKWGDDGSADHGATGGFLGTNDARFAERAPTGVRHRSHQKMIAAQAPGLAVMPKVSPVYYDCGNSTYDQTNRLMKFERDRSLGTDIGAGWVAPIAGTLTAYLEAQDANGYYLKDVNVHDVIALDDWLTPEFAGNYEVMAIPRLTAPSANSLATVELDLHQYNANAYTDVSDAPGDSYATVPGQSFQFTGFAPVWNPAWNLQCNLSVVPVQSGGTTTFNVTVNNLIMQILGVAGTTSYPSFTLTGLPNNARVIIYVDDTTGTGAGATFGWFAGYYLDAPPPNRYVILDGIFNVVQRLGTTNFFYPT